MRITMLRAHDDTPALFSIEANGISGVGRWRGDVLPKPGTDHNVELEVTGRFAWLSQYCKQDKR